MNGLNETASTEQRAATRAEWDRLLDQLRALSGEADNIVPAHDPLERGLFPNDPAKPFVLRVPENLFFRLRDIEFVGDAIRIKSTAQVEHAEREFFERYQRTFSWGGPGQCEAARFISMLDTLPPELRKSVGADFAMQDVLEGDFTERTHAFFLRSRAINWKGESAVIPFVDLANRGNEGFSWNSDQHGALEIVGHARGEIILAFGAQDSLGIFRKFAMAATRPVAFSLPMTASIGSTELTIGRNVMIKTGRAGFAMPEINREPGKIFLSHLMLGNSNFPRAPRGMFETLMREAGLTGSGEAFDRVLHANRKKFLDLLEALEPLHGEMVAMLRSMACFQLEALFHCVGTRGF